MDEFTGLFVPLITPFGADGELAADALERLARRVLDDGAAGIVALGTTAEAAALTAAERSRVLQICDGVCRERGAPLIAGTGSADTAQSVAQTAELASFPAVSAALVVVPYYVRPGEAGVIEHFRAVTASSPVPVIVYNVPYRTGQAVSWPTLARLAGLPGVAGIKHAVGAIDLDTVAMMAGRPPGFRVLGGDDPFISPLLGLGADGGILASAHLRTSDYARLIGLWRDGEASAARQLGHQLAALSRALFAEPNPVVIKAVLHELGEIPAATVRLPLLAASPAAAQAARQLAVVTAGGSEFPGPADPTQAARVA